MARTIEPAALPTDFWRGPRPGRKPGPDYGPVKHRFCASCGDYFQARRAEARYCSGACRQAAYRER